MSRPTSEAEIWPGWSRRRWPDWAAAPYSVAASV